MKCECNRHEKFGSNDSIGFEEKYLKVVKVDAAKWRTLYQCNNCGTFWEERDLNGRFGVDVELVKLKKDYIREQYPDIKVD